MTKPCAHCGGAKSLPFVYSFNGVPCYDLGRYRCDACRGTGKTDDAEYEPETCECNGDGCRRCTGSGEVWRKVESETTKEVDE